MYKKATLSLRVTALVLIIALLCPVTAYAVEPRASHYLTSYNAYPYSAGLGKIQIWFTVTGVDYMDELGSLKVMIYESTDNSTWTWKKTFTHDSTSGMLAHDVIYHSGHVEYQGVIGRYYKAYICIWAGKDGGGDTRYFWTGSQKATLFAQPTV